MITEEQANKIIELLTKIEASTAKTKSNTEDISSLLYELEEFKKHFVGKKINM